MNGEGRLIRVKETYSLHSPTHRQKLMKKAQKNLYYRNFPGGPVVKTPHF